MANKGSFVKGDKRAGRKPGVPNKLTASAKQAFLLAYQGIGGDAAFQKWAKSHPNQFYALFARLIPTEVSGPDGGDISVAVKKIEHVHIPALPPTGLRPPGETE